MRKIIRFIVTVNSYNNGSDLSPVQQIISLKTETYLKMKIFTVTFKLTLYKKYSLLLQKEKKKRHISFESVFLQRMT